MLDPEELDGFLDSVSEVSCLIDGLKAGTISPEYVDTKLRQQGGNHSRPQLRMTRDAAQPASARDQPCKSPPTPQQQQEQQQEQPQGQDGAQQEELMRKVRELQENRARKLRAREQYEAHIASSRVHTQSATDYAKWDLWCPEDEEDELFNSLTPNTPQFRAMEKDIDERHRRMVEQRQLAERERVRGNEAYKRRQYGEALRCYEAGLDAQRHNMALHANAAMAALKLQAYVQAIEHCDKVIHLARLLHNTPEHPLCGKAYQRRAAAHEALGHLKQAMKDLEAAAAIDPANSEVAAQLQRVSRLRAEERQCKEIGRALARGAEGAEVSGNCDVAQLRQVEELVGSLKGCSGAASGDDAVASEVAVLGTTLSELLEGNAYCRTHFWRCGGLDAAARLVNSSCGVDSTSTDDDACVVRIRPDAARALLLTLNAASHNDTNLERMHALGVQLTAVKLLGLRPLAADAALLLLATLSTNDGARKQVAHALCERGAAGLRGLMRGVTDDSALTRNVALTVLTNSAVHPPVQAAARSVLEAEPELLPALLDTRRSNWERARALAALTNLCGDVVTRQVIARRHLPMVMRVGGLCVAPRGGASPRLGTADGGGEDELRAAASGCLCNVCAEPEVQAALAGSPLAEALLALATAAARRSRGVHLTCWERAAILVSRIARHDAGVAALQSLRGVERLVRALAQSLPLPHSREVGEVEQAAARAWRDACVRALALLTADGTHFQACDASQATQAVRVLLGLLPCAHRALAGNICLCLSHVAANAAWLDVLHDADCVSHLVAVAQQGQGDAASKNAAIALAKMARLPAMMDRLRQLHGIEIVYQYVRP